MIIYVTGWPHSATFAHHNVPFIITSHLVFPLQNGLFSAIPYVMFWLFINIGGFVADTMRSRGWRTQIVRKIMYCMGE